MNAADLPATLGMELKRRKYFIRMDVLEQTLSLAKIRLYISLDLFVQIYRNDRYQTTNLALIYNGQPETPEKHDTSKEGRKSVEISEFLDEVEQVLAALDLP